MSDYAALAQVVSIAERCDRELRRIDRGGTTMPGEGQDWPLLIREIAALDEGTYADLLAYRSAALRHEAGPNLGRSA